MIRLSRDGRVTQAGGASPAAAGPSANGTDTGDPTQYPNSANGIVYGVYDDGVDPVYYQCSGSAVNTPTGNAVLTAGHCVIDPDTGILATDLIFVPGFREYDEPYGEWTAPTFATTSQWQSTAGGPNPPDEAGDMALLTVDNRPSDSATLESVVGAVGIAFNQSRSQTYMQYGYPAESPYDGNRLCETTSTLRYNDPNFSPPTMGSASDFTPGSSGGPWLVGIAPVAMSVTDYSYPSLPGYMFGPYFGSIAQNLFVGVGGSSSGSSATGTIPALGSTPCVGAVTSNAAPVAHILPPNAFVIASMTRNRQRGLATFWVKVPGSGTLKLNGHGLVRVVKEPGAKGTVALPVRAKGSTLTTLRDAGRVWVHARIAYTPMGGEVNRKSRDLVLLRHD